MSAFFDHMWQSLQVIGCLAVFAWLTRNNSARFRIWLWRVAALKLVIPMQTIVMIGAWIGFPVTHSADPPPARLVKLFDDLQPWFSPAGQLGVAQRWMLFVVLLVSVVAAGLGIRRRLHLESSRVAEEYRRLEQDADDHPRGVGFLNAALISAWALVLVAATALAGAIDDRLRRQEMLHRNERALRNADVIIRPAKVGMGSRYRVVAEERGITLRNATLREIGGMAYGVSVYLVRGRHFVKEGEEDWLTGPRHDVYITGPVPAPEEFDTYALRQPLTQALATQFGLEIYDNGQCVAPCGKWGSYVLPAAARDPRD